MTNKRKKICFISLQAYSLFNQRNRVTHGGSELQLYILASFLAKIRRFEISFLVGDFGQKPKENFRGVQVIRGVPLVKERGKFILKLYYLAKLLWTINKIDADIYFQRAAGLETGLVSFYCKLFGKKFIYMTASEIDVNGKYERQHKIIGLFYRYGIKHADTIITQNNEHRRILKKKHGIHAKVIKNSFIIPKNVADVFKKKYILWVGTSQPLKQPELFVKMATNMPEERFVMIMPKHNVDLWNKVKKDSKKITNLEFIEKVPFKEIRRYFSRAKLFVNTSTFEGFPNTFVQATMYATPIASLNVNPDNFLEKFSCGFCSQGSMENLIQFSSDLLGDKRKWRKWCSNAREYAEKNHNILNNIKKVLVLLD